MAEFRFINACFQQPVDKIPLWMMRQAGRYLLEYKEIRAKADFLTLCRTPKLAAEVTVQPIRRFDLDAAILFSDILVPLLSLGIDINFNPGPVISPPIRTSLQIDELKAKPLFKTIPYVHDSIVQTQELLLEKVPLIGFCGSPFTLAAYLIEGQGSKDWSKLKQFMYSYPESFHSLMRILTDMTINYLNMQISAGVNAVQIFNTWAIVLSPDAYKTFVLPYEKEIIKNLIRPKNLPVILFAQGSASLIEHMQEAKADVYGIDWRVSIGNIRKRLIEPASIQGNMDPTILLSSKENVVKEAKKVLEQAGDPPKGFIFNLGHGILPETPIDNVHALIETVHEYPCNF